MVTERGVAMPTMGNEAHDAGHDPVTSADVKAAWAVMAALFVTLFLLI